jgi:hypothetical protein
MIHIWLIKHMILIEVKVVSLLIKGLYESALGSVRVLRVESIFS